MEQHTAEVWVKVFAILAWIGAAASLLFGLVFIVGGPLVSSLLRDQLSGFGDLIAAAGVVLGIVFLGIAVLYFFVGRGLWLHQNWARIVLLVFAWISAVASLLSIIGALVSTQLNVLLQNLVSLGIAGFEIWLFQYEPTVKALFVPQATPVAKAAPKTVVAKKQPSKAKKKQ